MMMGCLMENMPEPSSTIPPSAGKVGMAAVMPWSSLAATRTVERRLTGGAALAATASAAANPPKLNALRMEMTLNKWR